MPVVPTQVCCITGCSGSRTTQELHAQELHAQAPRPFRIHRTPVQSSCSPLLSCPSKQGCRQQAAATAAESPLACASLPSLPCTAWEPGAGRLHPGRTLPAMAAAASRRVAQGSWSCHSPDVQPSCGGTAAKQHQQRLGPGGSSACCQNDSSDTQPIPDMLQSCTQGRRLWEQAVGLINCPTCHKSCHSVG